MSSASIKIDASGLHLGFLKVHSEEVKDALAVAVEAKLKPKVLARTPYAPSEARGTPLRETWFLAKSRGGDNTIAVGFDSVYARWVHEHLHFHHPHGGHAKFLEQPMHVHGWRTIEFAAKQIVNRL